MLGYGRDADRQTERHSDRQTDRQTDNLSNSSYLSAVTKMETQIYKLRIVIITIYHDSFETYQSSGDVTHSASQDVVSAVNNTGKNYISQPHALSSCPAILLTRHMVGTPRVTAS